MKGNEMTQPYAKGTLDSIEVVKAYKTGSKFEAVVAGQAVNGFGQIGDGVAPGVNVVVWKNGEGRDTKLSINVDTRANGTTTQPTATAVTTTSTTRGVAATTVDTRQASIVAQNAFNRGVDIMHNTTLAAIAAVANDVSGVKKGFLKELANPDYQIEMAKHYGSLIFDALMAGDLTADLPSFEAPTTDSDSE